MMKEIKMEFEDDVKAQELGLFDVLLVLYTDLTDEEVNTPAQKEFAARTRDPVVFGMCDSCEIEHNYKFKSYDLS